MTCEECLSTLATVSLREMTPDSPVMAHCATCPDCARVTTLVLDKEYDAASVLNNLPPLSNPITVAEGAVVKAQRRRKGRVLVMISGAALLLTLWFAAARIVIPLIEDSEDPRRPLDTETIALSCLSPEQAGELIKPYIRSRGGAYWVPSPTISAITVRGTADERATARELIKTFESDPGAACRVLPGVAPTPGTGKNPP